jgi:2'-5' RNA ligase
MDTIRTFIAVETSAVVRERALTLIDSLQLSAADVKWVGAHQMHLTLKFLGDVPAADTDGLCQTVAEVAQQFPPLELVVRGAGAFPDLHRPRTVWLGVAKGLEPLTHLARELEHRLARLGYPPEDRGFHPHLTLGRVRGGGPAVRDLAQRIRDNADFEAGPTQVEEVVTFASELQRTGPTYTVLGRARLGSTGGHLQRATP